MTTLKTIFSALTGGLFKDIRGLVDDVVTSKEEKLEIASKLKIAELAFQEKADQLELNFEKELSERHKNDMASDSWFSKNIRPLTLIATVTIFSVLSFMDANSLDFEVPVDFVSTWKIWGIMVFGFYFGSRGFEKITKVIKDKK